MEFTAWQLTSLIISLVAMFLGFVFAVWKIVNKLQGKQIDTALAQVKEAACKAKEEAAAASCKAEDNEKDLLRLRADLPIEYVRRGDWIRNQTIIEAKLDSLAAKFDRGEKQ